jgi:hypothetical protein
VAVVAACLAAVVAAGACWAAVVVVGTLEGRCAFDLLTWCAGFFAAVVPLSVCTLVVGDVVVLDVDGGALTCWVEVPPHPASAAVARPATKRARVIAPA